MRADLNAVRRPVSALPVVAKIGIPGFPDWVGIDESRSAVWVSNRDRNSISRVDAAANKLAAEVPVRRVPCSGLAVGHNAVWVPCCADQRVVRVHAGSLRVVAEVRVRIALSEGGIAADGRAVWVPSDRGATLARIDPETNTVVAAVAMPHGSFTAATGFGAVWVSSTANDLVSRLDVGTNRVVAAIPVGPSPRPLAAGFGSVWVLNQGDGTVSRIDAETHQVVATVELHTPGEGGDIAAGAGAVWVTNLGRPLSRIDPATNRVTAQFVGPGGDAVRVGLGSVWLCSFGLQQLWRIDPARI